MTRVIRALVLSGVGLNCDRETAYAFERAGAVADRVLYSRLEQNPDLLRQYDAFAIPGGFSFGDDLGAGKVLAAKMKHRMGDYVDEFIRDGKPLLGICNGYQVLVKMGVLPDLSRQGKQEATLYYNDSGRFEDRWTRLKKVSDRCRFLDGIDEIDLPGRHGEGKLVADAPTLAAIEAEGLGVLQYVEKNGGPDPGYPDNPNGSVHHIAALCNRAGNVLGIMPHPEANVSRCQHPRWTRENLPEEGPGIQIFRNAVELVRKNC